MPLGHFRRGRRCTAQSSKVGLRDRPIGLCSTRQQRPSQSRRRPSRCNGCNGYNSGLAAAIRQECTTTVCRTAVWHWDGGRWSSKCSCSRRRSTPARARPTRCVCCIASVVHCMSLVACPALNAACCMWHVACCTVVALSTAAGRRDDALARLPPRRTATAGSAPPINLRSASLQAVLQCHVSSRHPIVAQPQHAHGPMQHVSTACRGCGRMPTPRCGGDGRGVVTRF
jgi:hypothetical protein